MRALKEVLKRADSALGIYLRYLPRGQDGEGDDQEAVEDEKRPPASEELVRVRDKIKLENFEKWSVADVREVQQQLSSL